MLHKILATREVGAPLSSNDLIRDVADTAFWVAHYRALESRRPDALFRDPLAERLAGERGRRIAEHIDGGKYTQWSVVMRTVIIDAFLERAIAEGVQCVVNLGAGLDTRPYRMKLPASLRWVEVDQAPVVAYKSEQLASERPVCSLERIACDLADAEARRATLQQLGKGGAPTLVLTEGVVPYLDLQQAAALADDLHQHPSFRFWVIDYFAPKLMDYLQRRRRSSMKNAPFQFRPADWHAFFEEHGWRQREVRYFADVAVEIGRMPPMPLLFRLLAPLMGKKQRAQFRTNVGYVLLEPRARI